MSPHMISAAELFRFRSRPHTLIRDLVLLGGLVRVLRIRVAQIGGPLCERSLDETSCGVGLAGYSKRSSQIDVEIL